MWLLHYYIFVKFILISAEVLTLMKDNNITCVLTEDSVYSALYVTSLDGFVNVNRTDRELTNWAYTDWNTTKRSTAYGPVVDQRWMDFRRSFPVLSGIKLGDARAFSVCINNIFSLGISSADNSNITYFNFTTKNKGESCQWRHYVMTRNNRTIVIQSNDGDNQTNTTEFDPKFDPQWLIFPDDNHKLHEYTFVYSNIISSNKSYIHLNSSKCISMFVSVDHNCYLNVTLESDDQVSHIPVYGFNKNEAVKKWKRIEIQSNSDGEKKLFFDRRRSDNETQGYWAIDDIQNCKSEKIYSVIVNTNNTNQDKHLCTILDSSSEASSNSCNVPFIGKQCNISCGEILGESYPHCEKHRICSGDQCQCAWGYQGSFCNETCKSDHWGLNCVKTCSKGCAICNITTGCTQCKEKYFGKDCSKELPVIQTAPVLQSVTNDSIKIVINLKHDDNTTEPEFYLIQYKENDGTENFKNYSHPHNYSLNSNVTVIMKIFSRQKSYRIRVILISKNMTFEDNIPELILYEHSLRSNVKDNGTIELNWNRPEGTNVTNFTVEYECLETFCSNDEKNQKQQIIAKTTGTKISNLGHFSICTIQLFAKDQLIDETTVIPLDSSKKIRKADMPKYVVFSERTLLMELEKCETFSGPLTYHLEYRCMSEWCKNSTTTDDHELKSYHSTVRVDVQELAPFTSYEVYITAKRQNQTDITQTYSNITTPPNKPYAVENVSVYCSTNDTVWIKWTEHYPPTGKVEAYNITYQKDKGFLNFTNFYSACELWNNFICANISGLESEADYQIKVQAKNFNVSEWGEPHVIEGSTGKKVSQAPENVQIKLSNSSNEIILKWEHPLYTYGKLEKFCIEIDGNSISKNITKSYNKITIKVKHGRKYTFRIWGKNEFNGENATIYAIISSPITGFSSRPSVAWCSKTCHLTVPKPIRQGDLNFTVAVTKNKDKGRTTFVPSKNNIGCIQSDSDDTECEIDRISFEAIRNQTGTINLEHGNKTFRLDFVAEDVTTGHVISITAGVLGVVLVVLFLGLLYYAYKRKKFPFKKLSVKKKREGFQLIELREINSLIPQKNPSSNENFSNSKLVGIDDFENYLLTSLEEDPDDNEVTQQYEAVPKMKIADCTYGQLPENFGKNRYKNILAYDDTRVILNNSDEGGYINANYIDGYESPKAFIATQAPLPSTVHDFWLMVCQEKVHTIIMLTEVKENGIIKSEQYWPEQQSKFRFGKFLIENIFTKVTPNYIHRELKVKCDDETHLVQHFQYVTWPDHGVPLCIQSFVSFMKKIMKLQPYPVIVHCNAGCGRTGTFILCDIVLRMAMKTKRVDFVRVLKAMREQRPAMVTKVDQYIFAHFVVLEYFFGQEFSIPVNDDFQVEIQKALDKISLDLLLKRLEKARMQYGKTQFKLHSHLTDEEKAKNRFPTILPGHSQVFLPVSSHDPSNYINAITVDCYRYPKKFIVTQQPMPNTIEDFWRIVKEYEVDTIVSLNKIDIDDPLCPRFWPNDSTELWWFGGTNTLSLFSQDTTNIVYDIVRVKIGSTSEDLDSKIVNIIEMKTWKRETLKPLNITDLIDVWKNITSSKEIVITCYDGATASGLFVALAYLLEKINMDHTCDVFSAVKTVQQSRPQFVEHPEQLEFLYQAAVEYVQQFSTYGNFN